MKFVFLLPAILGICAVSSAGPESAAAPGTAAGWAALAGRLTTYQLLQGKWQSIDDARSVVELKGHRYIDYYDGKRLATTALVLDRACPGTAGAGHPGDNALYLVEPKEGMCWEIIDVTKTSLSLSYTARGNTLNYRRIK